MKPAAIGLGLALLACGTEVHAACPDVEIEFNQAAISQAEQERLAQDLRAAAAKVCPWWGATFSARLTVDVPDADGPSMALVPAWRGKPGHMIFPAALIRRGNVATIHEVVHVFAPNGNRFQAEGLAVHAHDRLGGPRAFPNFGRDLNRGAGRHAGNADIGALDRLPTPAMLHLKGTADRQTAYLVSGSFVRHLVDRHGMDKFRQLYAMTPLLPGQRKAGDPGRWLEVYGLTLEQLSAEWRKSLASAP